MPTKKSNANEHTDRDHSIADWGKSSITGLRNKLKELQLSHVGKKIELQTRLFEHFNPPTDTTNIQLSDVLEEFRSMRTELDTLKNNIHNNNNINKTTQNNLITSVESPTHVNFETGQSRDPITPNQNNPTLTQQKNRNKNSAILITNDEQDEPYIEEQQNVFGFDLQQSLSQQPTQGTFNYSNPYSPPGLKTTTLNKIKKHEYVDFDDILPPPPSTNCSNELLGFQLDDNNNLYLKPNQTKSKIRDYPSWICAWNTYCQAYLHYHPDMHFKLFSYFKNIATIARKHKFESVYLYDKALRHTLAAQHSLPTDLRTASWCKTNDELFNIYLRETLLPSCYHCHSFGHYVSSCPYKTNSRSSVKTQSLQLRSRKTVSE
uniref:CCHC-type domain-containing protein n=1 Tax=Clytia hemisphaerica TaxID=252671 RepID=A0A7M5XI05_9CNID